MFENVGSKIKGLAVATFWIGFVASFILGIAYMVNYSGPYGGGNVVLRGLLRMGGGMLGSWLGSLIPYGFGQLIENSDVRTQLAVDESRTKKER